MFTKKSNDKKTIQYLKYQYADDHWARATTPKVPGNQEKIKWDPINQSYCLAALKDALMDYSSSEEFSKEFSTIVTMDLYQPSGPSHKINYMGS